MPEDNSQKLPQSPLQDALAPQKDLRIEPKSSPILSTQYKQVPENPANQKQSFHVTETVQKAIRTYESDVADVLAHKNISTTTIAMAEKKRKTGENRIGNKDIITEENKKGEGSHNTKKILIALTSLILIGLGVGGGYYFYLMSPLAITSTAKPQTPVITSLVPADSHVSLPIDNLTPINIINTVRAEMAKIQPNNTIKEIVPIQTNNAQKFRLNSTDMINTMDINAPDILKRSLSNDWMLGVYADNQGAKTVFIVADIDYFQNAFAGMLQWESVMPDDLKQYLFTNTPADISSTPLLNTPIPANTVSSTTGTTTATTSISSSTPPTSYQNSPTYNVFHGSFIDKIINNKDVREFQTNGQLVFLYSFIDNNNKLIITGSESALSEVLNRLEQNAFVR